MNRRGRAPVFIPVIVNLNHVMIHARGQEISNISQVAECREYEQTILLRQWIIAWSELDGSKDLNTLSKYIYHYSLRDFPESKKLFSHIDLSLNLWWFKRLEIRLLMIVSSLTS